MPFTQNDRQLSRSLNLIIFAITFGMVFFTVFGMPVGSTLFTGFMRRLGAGDLVYSVVMALPVLGAVSQVFGSYYMETTGKRRFLFLASGFVHRLLWIPVALLPLFTGVGMRTACIWIVTVLITISSVASSVSGIAFNSWMGALIPPTITGRFFGTRTLVSTVSGAVAGLLVGTFIDHVNDMRGFTIVFIIGSLFGVVDIATFFWVRHPPLIPPSKKPSLRAVLTVPLRNKNYMHLTLFATAYMFSVNVSAPFFNVYMLENLRMDYLIMALSTQIMTSITTILFVRRWGVLADRYGNRPVVLVGAVGIILLPIPWIFATSSHYAMVYLANLFGGIFWSGFNLALYNQSVWTAPQENRSSYIAFYTLFTNVIGTAAAYVCGGYFMQYVGPVIDLAHLPFTMGNPLNSYQALFILSSALRTVAIVAFFPLVRELNASSARRMVREEMQLFRERLVHR